MDLNQYRNDYADATSTFLAVARGVPDDQLDRHVPGGWSPRQIIHHLADAETESAGRLRRLVAEPAGSPLLAFDEDAWARSPALGYESLPVATSLAIVENLRASSLTVLERLSEHDLERYGDHSSRGRFSVADWLEAYSRHPRVHAEQILEALGA
ncbi:MAG: DinB family protein [Acidimicrobiales bacterium]